MRNYLIITCISLMLCQSAYSATHISHSSDYEILNRQIQTALKTHNPSDILLVFDNDDTLETLQQNIGSEPWVQWQLGVMQTRPESPYAIAHSQAELWTYQAQIYAKAHMRLTDLRLPIYLNNWQHKGIRALVLTARSPSMLASTRRELLNNHLDFSKTAPKAKAFKTNKKELYQDGILFVTGGNKGNVLKRLTLSLAKKPSVIFFVDDNQHNIDTVSSAFKDSKRNIFLLHYTRMQSLYAKFKQLNKAKLIEKWHKLKLSFPKHASAQIP